MSSQKRWVCGVGGFVFLTAAVVAVRITPKQVEAAGQGAEQKSTATADAEIRKTNSDYGAALAAGDLDAVMAFWAADADYIDEAGKQTKGNGAIAALFKKALPDLKGAKVNVRVHSLKFLRPEICLEDGTVEKTTVTGTKESSRFAVIWTKTGNKWLMSSARDLPTEVTDAPSIAATHLNELGWLVGEWVDDSPKTDVKVKVSWATNKAFLLMEYVIKGCSRPIPVNYAAFAAICCCRG